MPPHRGVLSPPQRENVTTLRALSPDTDLFVTSERMVEGAGAQRDVICVYDLASSASIAGMNPVVRWAVSA